MLNFNCYDATCRENSNNCLYPNKVVVSDKDSFIKAVSFDHVTVKLKRNYRGKDNFISSDCIPMDCDNKHSDNEDDWVTPLDVSLAFPDVCFYASYSRNHMKIKGDKSARPRFHIFFPIEKIKDARECANLKIKIQEKYPYFDKSAIDVGRLLFGVKNPQVELYEGERTVVDFILEDDFDDFDDELEKIKEGSRNSTMSHFAGKILKRYGDTDKARELFNEKAMLCSPPLSDEELETIYKSACKFYKKLALSDDYIPPDEYGQELKHLPDDYSDIGEAKVLASAMGDELVYTDSTGYMRYIKNHWIESKQLSVGACEDFLDEQYKEAENYLTRAKDNLIKKGISKELIGAGGKALEKVIDNSAKSSYMEFLKAMTYKNFVLKRRDMKYVTSTLQAAKPMILSDIREFDVNEYDLNTPNGTYDLRDGSVREHSAKDFITKITSVSPDRENMDLWLETLDTFFNADKELISYVKQNVGLVAIGKVLQEAMIIAYGEGRNGKSTFWNVIARVLGEYSGTISSDALVVGCKRNVKPEKAELKGKRIVIAAELEEGMRLNTSMVKQLTSTDEVTGEKKYKDPFSYVPTHTLVLYTNHLPKVGASDDGIWRRLIVIPFNAKIKGNKDIKNYGDYLYKKCGGAILTWIIEGAIEAIKNDCKLKEPKIVLDAIAKYREDNDWLGKFMEDRCELDSGYKQKSGEFYAEYRAYALSTGEYARSTTDFYNALHQMGFERLKNREGSFIHGLRLKSEFV